MQFLYCLYSFAILIGNSLMYAWHSSSCLVALFLFPFMTTPSLVSSALMSFVSIETTSGILKELVNSPEVLAERSSKLWQTPPRGKEYFIPTMATPSVRCATTIAHLGCFLSTCISFCALSGAFLGGKSPSEIGFASSG